LGLSRTQMKVLRMYPERFDPIAEQADVPDGPRHSLYTLATTDSCRGLCQEYEGPVTYTNKDGKAGCLECGCSRCEVFTIIADDAASLHDGAKEMRNCNCCGSWFQR
jgi:hypothetical protein